MRAGKKRTRVTFDRPTMVADGAGGKRAGWASAFSMWAEVHPMTAREIVRGDQLVGEVDTMVRIRYDPRSKEIDARWRVREVIAGTIYAIVRPPINKENRGAELEFLCSTGVNPG